MCIASALICADLNPNLLLPLDYPKIIHLAMESDSSVYKVWSIKLIYFRGSLLQHIISQDNNKHLMNSFKSILASIFCICIKILL